MTDNSEIGKETNRGERMTQSIYDLIKERDALTIKASHERGFMGSSFPPGLQAKIYELDAKIKELRDNA